MAFVHSLTRIRYKFGIHLGLNVHDETLEHIIAFCYRIPYFRKGINSKKRNRKLVVSLTTVPSRVNKAWLTTESLLRQKKRPDHIILWLAEDEFQDVELPKELIQQQKRGLEIRYCKNLKSYKKFYYAMLEYRYDYVVTVDDDFIYSENLLAEMMRISGLYPDCIVCNCAHKIRVDKNGPLPYLRWIRHEDRMVRNQRPSFWNFAVGCGGVLYPVWLMGEELFEKDIFMDIAPTADDVWMNFHAWRSKVKVAMTEGILGYMIPIHSSSDTGLYLENTARKTESCECENDPQIRNVLEYLNLNAGGCPVLQYDRGDFVKKQPV